MTDDRKPLEITMSKTIPKSGYIKCPICQGKLWFSDNKMNHDNSSPFHDMEYMIHKFVFSMINLRCGDCETSIDKITVENYPLEVKMDE